MGFTETFERVKLNPVGIRFERGKNGHAGRIVTVSFQVRDMTFDALQRMADAATGRQEVQIEVRFPQAAMDMDAPHKEQAKLPLGEDGDDAREDTAQDTPAAPPVSEPGAEQRDKEQDKPTAAEVVHALHTGDAETLERAGVTQRGEGGEGGNAITLPPGVRVLAPGLVPGDDARAQGITQPVPDPVLLHEVDLAARAIVDAGKDMAKVQEAMKGVVALDGKYPEAGVVRMVQVRVAYVRPSPESDDVLWDAAGAYHPGMVEMDNGKKRRPYVHPGWDPQVNGNGDKVKWLTSKGHWSGWAVVTPDSVKRLIDARRVLLDAAEMAAGAVYRTCPDHPQPHRHQGNHCGWEQDRAWRNKEVKA